MNRVWVVGSINIDTTYTVKRLPAEGETLHAYSKFSALGGKGSNQAVAASKTGAKVYLVGLTGIDAAGGVARSQLNDIGIDLSYLKTDAERPTGSAVICVDKDGANFIVVNGGANLSYTYTPLPFAAGDYVIAQLETPLTSVERCFISAKEAGAVRILNPSPSQTLSKSLLEVTDILIANEHEIEAISGIAYTDHGQWDPIMHCICRYGISKVVITLGKQGALLYDSEVMTYIPGIQVSPVIDTQGAGDAFAGVMVGMMAQGQSFLSAARLANQIAAACVKVSGSTIRSLSQIKL